jgi:hypothetical protein
VSRVGRGGFCSGFIEFPMFSSSVSLLVEIAPLL